MTIKLLFGLCFFAVGLNSGCSKGKVEVEKQIEAEQISEQDTRVEEIRSGHMATLSISKRGRAYADATYLFCSTADNGLYHLKMTLQNRSAETLWAFRYSPMLVYSRNPSKKFRADFMQFVSRAVWEADSALSRGGRSRQEIDRLYRLPPGETMTFDFKYGAEFQVGCFDGRCRGRFAELWELVLRDIGADDAAVYAKQGKAEALVKPVLRSKQTLQVTPIVPTSVSECLPAPTSAYPKEAPPPAEVENAEPNKLQMLLKEALRQPPQRNIDDEYDEYDGNDEGVQDPVQTPITQPITASLSSDDVEALVTDWIDAQNAGDFARYGGFYSSTFSGVRRSGSRTVAFNTERWLRDRKRMFKKPMQVRAEDMRIDFIKKDNQVRVRFTQTWRSGSYADVGDKELILAQEESALRIVREEMLNSTILK